MDTFPPVSFLHRLADAASMETLPRFRTTLEVEEKFKPGYRFDPVTLADKEAERVLRELISSEYPEHAILGEEFGETGTGPWKWVLDPVDGTRPFICGIPVWGTLIGLTLEGRSVMGMMSQPFTQERFWADQEAAWAKNVSGTHRMRTRSTTDLSRAILHTNSPERFGEFPDVRFERLRDSVQMTRYGGECYAFAMLAAGQIDLCLELSLQPYDIVALVPIIERAGGVVTGLIGERPEAGGHVLASANEALHERALRTLTP
ncbi:histidinol-phosphatase [Ensifer sp. BR816]|uniref:histidinol-phosphatase n=1 Tax=Rhizobium sp. (strain BR816) TaxID=1057002 RepID=UPI000361179F|nr:histidinol-phosphatase [Ensifer sp. BR816]